MTKLDSKCAREINGQLLNTLGADVLLSRKKTQKNLGGSEKSLSNLFFGKKITPQPRGNLRCRGVQRTYESKKSSLEQSMSAGYYIK